jgi:cystathionine beta-lyase/cystathionine gamma-synthase
VPSVDRSTIWPYRKGEPGEFYYQRYAHPTGVEAERRLGELDGGHAVLFSSGTGAAIALALAFLAPGDTIALAEGAYFGTSVGFGELARWGLRHVEFDQTGPPPDDVQLVWLEAPSNPFLTMPDLDAARRHPAAVLVDATAATPIYLRPLERGVDFVLHSATKYLAGHNDALLGAVVCKREEDAARLKEFRTRTGIVAAPDPCYLLLRGLKTLEVRVTRQTESARELAARLQRHPSVTTVRYPGRPVRRDLTPPDHERDEPRRRRLRPRVASALGGRPRAARPAPSQRRPGTGRGPLERLGPGPGFSR